jgi:ubiquinone/menaquinone biosynthesis C-methylase UbiE
MLLSAGLKKGMSCIDIGCGSGSVTKLMATIVEDVGSVVGVDMEAKYLEYCNRTLIGTQNLEFVQDDICKSRLDMGRQFDIVYSRFLFHHLAERKEAVRSMKRLVKKGGTIMIQDVDHGPG